MFYFLTELSTLYHAWKTRYMEETLSLPFVSLANYATYTLTDLLLPFLFIYLFIYLFIFANVYL